METTFIDKWTANEQKDRLREQNRARDLHECNKRGHFFIVIVVVVVSLTHSLARSFASCNPLVVVVVVVVVVGIRFD